MHVSRRTVKSNCSNVAAPWDCQTTMSNRMMPLLEGRFWLDMAEHGSECEEAEHKQWRSVCTSKALCFASGTDNHSDLPHTSTAACQIAKEKLYISCEGLFFFNISTLYVPFNNRTHVPIFSCASLCVSF